MSNNIRYDDIVHAVVHENEPVRWNSEPLCGDSMIPVELPRVTTDAVTCSTCKSILE